MCVCVWLIKTWGEYLPGDQHFLHHQMLLTWPGTARETLQQRQDIAQPAGKAVRVTDSQKNCRCLAKVNRRVDRKHIHIRLQSNVSQVILMLLYPEGADTEEWQNWKDCGFLASLSVGTDILHCSVICSGNKVGRWNEFYTRPENFLLVCKVSS